MRTLRSLAGLVGFLTLAVGAWADNQTVLYDFAGGNDGSYPLDYGRLARDSSGNLFGTTEFGGSCSQGTLFQLSPTSSGWSETVLHTFCGGEDGSAPTGSVTLDLAGNIYGTTTGAGNGTCGTAFEFTAGVLNTLHSFGCSLDGGNPVGDLMRAGGNLYGTASGGGENGWGVVYEISHAGKFSVLYSFCQLANCADGAVPSGGLAADSHGNLYGTTFNGGDLKCVYATPGCGTVFQLSKVGSVWHEHVLHKFTGSSNDGANPLYASLTLTTEEIAGAKVFMIFGVTSAGGKGGAGTAFQIIQETTGGYGFKVLHSFTCCYGDGAMPEGTLLLSSGHLIGTTPIGGNSDSGSVFELSLKNGVWTETILYNFLNGADGGHPYSGVIADTHGNLYGVASSDGGEFGAVYELTP